MVQAREGFGQGSVVPARHWADPPHASERGLKRSWCRMQRLELILHWRGYTVLLYGLKRNLH